MKKQRADAETVGMIVSAFLIVFVLIVRFIVHEEINWYSSTMFILRVFAKNLFVCFVALLFFKNVKKLRKTMVYGAIKKYNIIRMLSCCATAVIAEAEIIRNELYTPSHSGALLGVMILGLASYSLTAIAENAILREIPLRSKKFIAFFCIYGVVMLAAGVSVVLTWVSGT